MEKVSIKAGAEGREALLCRSLFPFHFLSCKYHLLFVFSHMEESVYRFCCPFVHAGHLGQFFYSGFTHFVKRAEGMPQGVSSGGADAFDVVQDGFGISLIRPFPVVGDDEAVGFVANELEELEGRFVMIQNDGVFGTFHVDFLHSLGQADDRASQPAFLMAGRAA